MTGVRTRPTRCRPTWRSVLLGLTVGCLPAATSPATLCPTPHRFEAWSLLAPSLGHAKRILAYLPPGYDCAARERYPVFYFSDGHDLFDWNPFALDLDPAVAAEIAAREGWYGSWRLDQQLDRAIINGDLPPMIIIGIASDDGMRSRDLAPVPWRGSDEVRGRQYGDFIAETVVLTVDRRYRTAADRRCRGIGGASLGGVSALRIGLDHGDRFGLVLALSPVLGDPAIADDLARAWPVGGDAGPSAWRIDFDDDPIGTADRAWFASVVGTTGYPARQTALVQTPDGRHTIASWADRVIPAMMQLFRSPTYAACPQADPPPAPPAARSRGALPRASRRSSVDH